MSASAVAGPGRRAVLRNPPPARCDRGNDRERADDAGRDPEQQLGRRDQREGERRRLVRGAGAGQCQEIAGGVTEGVGAEENPAGHDHEQRVGVAERGERRRLETTCGAGALEDQEETVPRPPGHEGPRRAVPEPAEQEDEHQVRPGPQVSPAVSPERDVQVVPEPGRERDVPAPPELAHRRGAVGVVEILEEREPEHPADADGHVGITGEIEVDLEGVADQPEPGRRGAEGRGRQREDAVGGFRHGVRDEHLLAEPDDEPPDPRDVLFGGDAVRDELGGHVPVAHDRAGDQLRKERLVDGEIQQAPRRPAPRRAGRRPGRRAPGR